VTCDGRAGRFGAAPIDGRAQVKKIPIPKRRPKADKALRARPVKPSRAQRDRRPGVATSIGEPERTTAAEVPSAGTDIVLSTPELGLAGRALSREPERPLPTKRRAIFFDVENTSRPAHITRVIDHLAIDWAGWRTEIIAVGNWKVIGRDTARLLAQHGAQLVHSAPSVGVSDWSDLRIGVAAGVWLAGARPGDVLEIITNDRAFDAVGDVAASLGIAYRRLSHQGLVGAAIETAAPAPGQALPPDSHPHRRGRGRRHRGRGYGAAARATETISRSPVPAAVHPPTPAGAETPPWPHTAPHDEIIAVVHDLMQRSPTRSVTLDALANALKTRGFSRPPGSPRLITRLRRIKEISVSRSGVITLLGEGATTLSREPGISEATPAAPTQVQTLLAPDMPSPVPAAPVDQAPHRRRSRRGGRRRRPRSEGAPVV
jgi:hypothetical protein